MPPIKTIILHPDPCQKSSLFIASETLDAANRVSRLHGRGDAFTFTTLTPDRCWPGEKKPDLVILPGLGLTTERELQAAMKTEAFKRLVTVLTELKGAPTVVSGACSACFALGAAGLLDSRKVTTSWWLIPALQNMFPSARPISSEIVLHDGNVVTAGAAFSQIDLMLFLIEHFAGFAVAEDCRRFLMADSRPSQLPYMSVAAMIAGDPALQKAELHLRRNIVHQVTLADLASSAGLGTRTFARRLSRAAAMTPSTFIQTVRVTEAIRLARTSALNHDEIAARVGYADATVLRRAMRKRTGQTLESFRK